MDELDADLFGKASKNPPLSVSKYLKLVLLIGKNICQSLSIVLIMFCI